MTLPDKSGLAARLARLNVTAVFLGAVAYVLLALFAPGVIGGILLLALAAALAWLLTMTWPLLPARVRAGRLLMLGLLLAAALFKIM